MPTDYAFPPVELLPHYHATACQTPSPFDDHIGRLLSQDFANLLGDGVGSLR